MTDALRLRAPLAAAVAAVLVAGCGGQAATKQDVIARGNAVCAAALRDLRATPPPAGGETSLSGLAAYLQSVMPTLRHEVSSLEALPRPTTDRAVLNQFLSAMQGSQTTYRELAAAAGRGDQSGVNQALAQLQANPASSLAARYGLSQCGGAASTSVPR